jgi:KDO2-lipid IV(A) lauroyltransferase
MTRHQKPFRSAKAFFNKPFVIRTAMLIGRIFPRKVGLSFAALIGTILGSLKRSQMVRAIRANQYVIHQQDLDAKSMRKLPKVVFRSAAKCIFDYFYFLSRPEKLLEIVKFTPEAEAAFARVKQNQPCVIACPHLSNFDLMGYALALKGIDVQILSYPNPNGTYKIQNQIRESFGLNVTPMGFSAFREARLRLRNGGSVLTGLDRPVDVEEPAKHRPLFFGHPSNLPVAYVRMAKEAQAPVIVMAVAYQPNDTYILEASQPIWIEPHENPESETLENTEKVLASAGEFITQYNNQWAMFYPIWPEFLGV